MDDIVKMNVERVNHRLKDLVISCSETQRKLFNNYKITCNDGKTYTLEDIDFKKSLIFVCEKDFLAYISYYGMLKINNIQFPDNTQSGTYSMIKTSYMIVDSQDIRFSKIPMDAFYQEKRDGLLPDSWNSINYVIKDVCMWRLVSSVGIGEDKKMYDGCYSWISERFRNGKIDWIFYVGTDKDFLDEYTNVSSLDIPIYKLVLKGKNEEKSNIKTHKLSKDKDVVEVETKKEEKEEKKKKQVKLNKDSLGGKL